MTPIVRLVPMRPAAYDRWGERSVREYAAEHVAAGNWPAEGALERSEAEFSDLLPDALATAGQHLWTIEDDDGADVGILLAGPRRGHPDALFIWDFAVEPAARGRGLGRAALEALDAWARNAGYGRIGLHVFGSNDTARRLYARAGFTETDVMMEKRL